MARLARKLWLLWDRGLWIAAATVTAIFGVVAILIELNFPSALWSSGTGERVMQETFARVLAAVPAGIAVLASAVGTFVSRTKRADKLALASAEKKERDLSTQMMQPLSGIFDALIRFEGNDDEDKLNLYRHAGLVVFVVDRIGTGQAVEPRLKYLSLIHI